MVVHKLYMSLYAILQSNAKCVIDDPEANLGMKSLRYHEDWYLEQEFFSQTTCYALSVYLVPMFWPNPIFTGQVAIVPVPLSFNCLRLWLVFIWKYWTGCTEMTTCHSHRQRHRYHGYLPCVLWGKKLILANISHLTFPLPRSVMELNGCIVFSFDSFSNRGICITL